MPTWAAQSFAVVAQGSYLDSLAVIYPVADPVPRHVNQATVAQLREALSETDDTQLLQLLLDLEKFPFNDPYVGFLRENPSCIDDNPITVGRICSRLREMGIDEVVEGLEEPRQANRQMGQLFNRWLHSNYRMIADAQEFIDS